MKFIHKHTTALIALAFTSLMTTTDAISADQITDYEKELLQAIRCTSSSDCSQFMLRGALNNQPEIIDVAAARMPGFAKPMKGNSSLAREYNKKGLDAFRSKDYQTASDLFGLGYQADPADVEIVANYGYALSMSGKGRDALSKLVLALSIDPRRTSNWAPLIKVYHDLGMQKEALGAGLLAYYYSTSKEKTLIYLKDKAVTENPPSLSAIYQAAYAKVSAQDGNVRPQSGASEVSSGIRPVQQLQSSPYAYKMPEVKGARPANGSRSERNSISTIGQLKHGVQYTSYAKGSCPDRVDEVCLTDSEYKFLCENARHVSKMAVRTFFEGVSDKGDYLADNGDMEEYKIYWDKNRYSCRLNLTLRGIYYGNSARESGDGRVTHFMLAKDGEVMVSSAMTLHGD